MAALVAAVLLTALMAGASAGWADALLGGDLQSTSGRKPLQSFYTVGADGYCPTSTQPCHRPFTSNTNNWVMVLDRSAPRTQSQSATYCQTVLGMQLASVHEPFEQADLVSMRITYTTGGTNVTTVALIGLNCPSKTQCVWSDASLLVYTAWKNGEPRTNNGACTVTDGLGWFSRDCATADVQFACRAYARK